MIRHVMTLPAPNERAADPRRSVAQSFCAHFEFNAAEQKRRRGNSRQRAATSGHPSARRGEKHSCEQRRLYDFTASRLDQSMKSDSAMRRRQRIASTK
jgi:hypothetical protein